MSSAERELRHGKLYEYVSKHTSGTWARGFLSELKAASEPLGMRACKLHICLRIRCARRGFAVNTIRLHAL